jgi:hypothetical protein
MHRVNTDTYACAVLSAYHKEPWSLESTETLYIWDTRTQTLAGRASAVHEAMDRCELSQPPPVLHQLVPGASLQDHRHPKQMRCGRVPA